MLMASLERSHEYHLFPLTIRGPAEVDIWLGGGTTLQLPAAALVDGDGSGRASPRTSAE